MVKSLFIFALVLAVVAAALVRYRLATRAAGGMDSVAGGAGLDVAGVLRNVSASDSAQPQPKPWAEHFAAFITSHSDRQWIVGRCDRPGLSEAEAAESARSDAANQLIPRVRQRLSIWRGDRAWLGGRVLQDVRDGRLDFDRDAQRFDRPYAQVWAESVLLDVSPDRLDPLINRYAEELQLRHIGLERHLALGAILVLITWIAYFVFNSVSQGYFTTRLRLIAAALTAGIVLLA